MLKQFFSLTIICFALASCKPDPCKDVDCNNGTCESGNCICEAGYEGFNCEVEQRLAFVGDYSVNESCDLGNFNYVINVTAETEVGTELTIHNIGDFDFDLTAHVNGNTFAIEDSTNGATVSGTGELANDVLSIVYTLETSSNQTLNCTMACSLIE